MELIKIGDAAVSEQQIVEISSMSSSDKKEESESKEKSTSTKKAKSKKEAEQIAAKLALDSLNS